MFDLFMYAINAILPLILLIVLGYFLRQRKMFDETFFKKANTLVFRVCLPTLLCYNIYNIEGLTALRWDVVGYCLVIIALLFVIAFVMVKLWIPDPKQKGVIMQCVFRSNYAIIGIPVAEALGGADAVAIASLLSAFSIPMYNIMAVIALSMYVQPESGAHGEAGTGRDEKGLERKNPSGSDTRLKGRSIKRSGIAPKQTLLSIWKNPLIRGVLAGVLLLVIRSLLPKNADGAPVFTIRKQLPFIYSAVQSLSRIASPLALLVLGGQFTFSAVKGMKQQIVIGTLARTVMAPLLGVGFALILSQGLHLLNFGMVEFPSLIALFGTPVAVSSAIMADEMGNDGVLAGQLVVWTSLVSIVTMFLTIVAVRAIVGM